MLMYGLYQVRFIIINFIEAIKNIFSRILKFFLADAKGDLFSLRQVILLIQGLNMDLVLIII